MKKLNPRSIKTLYVVVIFACLLPFIKPAIALCIGIAFALLGITNKKLSSYTTFTLQASIVLMGFGMNLAKALEASKTGFMLTTVSVIFVMVVGLLLAKLFKVDKKIGVLISAGTAICGGSAIAAISPIIKSEDYQVTFSMVVIFTLNAIALFIFPVIGRKLGLSQEVFGQWAAIAIHDTSSVVGAGATYGEQALEVATTIKLVRALWIIPLSLVIALFHRKDGENNKIKVPWFIFLFVLAIIFAYLFPSYQKSYEHLSWLGKRGMVIVLFLIGTNVSIGELKKAGPKSFLLGILLWIIISVSSYFFITRL
jgi:uncharacterized integral membrane protein (TIGR00698 family)